MEEKTSKNRFKEFMKYECKKCKLIFINPQPSYKELEKYYPTEDYYAFWGITKKEESKKVKLKLFLYDLYYNPKNKNKFLKLLFSPIKFLVRGVRMGRDQKLLDFGSGSGQFLYEMKQFGIDVWGIEPGDFDKSTAKSLRIKPDLMEAKYPNDFFDIVTMNHVLQHVNNPTQILKEIHRVLDKKGVFILGVSNYRSLAYSLFTKNWLQLDIPRHLSNYSDKLLCSFLEKNNFQVIRKYYNSRPNQFVDSLYFKLNIVERRGILYKILKILFLPLTWIVNALKLGDQMEVWCVKK